MKSFSLLLLLLPDFSSSGNAQSTTEIQDGQTGTLMVVPPRQTDTGTKQIPALLSSGNAQSPTEIQDGQTGTLMVVPPRQTDTGTKRIPVAMNTLANHGYISRNGITSFEEIIHAVGEAFNIDRDVGSGMAALNILTRGNPFVNKVSIGGVSPLVPALPGQIDGPETQGIAKHGRVEGDASMTRSDVHIGDNRNFNQTRWNLDLEQLAKFGDDGPDGPATVFNLQTLIELKRQNLESDQSVDPGFALPIRRLNTAFGTTKQGTKQIISSFFMNQTFPETGSVHPLPFWAHPFPLKLQRHCPSGSQATTMKMPPPPFNISSGCANYWDTLGNAVPSTLANVTGLFKQNVDLLTGILFSGSGCPEPVAPAGPTNV
ncbi:hypothetical protein DFH09DRAFT_1106131 [Mycena vulgaris]|nr:hypothetical protein DFH09DRAFT_1106131 [Mycena vulgaris]